MTDYTQFQCEDFVADSYFRQWVKQPDDASTRYWHAYLTNHPEQTDVITKATGIVRQLSAATASLADSTEPGEQAILWDAVRHRVAATEQNTGVSELYRHRFVGRTWLAAAASLLLVLGLIWWSQDLASDESGTVRREPATSGPLTPFINAENTTDLPQVVALPDGSSLILQKGSRVRYPRQFAQATRVVYLVGAAYFEVAKDPARPFIVHANELTTKVLGTSFNVRAYADDKHVVVTVRSGRVAVFAQSDEQQQRAINSPLLASLVLSRNEQVTFTRGEAQLVRSKESTPIVVSPKGVSLGTASFRYEDSPVSGVFRELEDAYGIKIVYDKDALRSCRLTADLTDEPLTEKIRIICKSIEASYTVQPTQFVISGPGCQP